MTKLLNWYKHSPAKFSHMAIGAHIPPTLASMKENPSKEELMNKRVKRFVHVYFSLMDLDYTGQLTVAILLNINGKCMC